MIPQPFIDELVSRIDIAEIISGYMPLKRAGRNFKGLCPFHGEKTPSFMVSSQKQIFHCFGCGEGGGAIQFIMLYEKVSFVEAVEMLAQRVGMQVPQKQDPQARIKTDLYQLVQEAADFFHQSLLNLAPAQQYLINRGINLEGIKQFRLGYAPGNNSLIKHLRSKGYSLENIEKSCLSASGYNGPRDMFMDRIMFPISDLRSRVVAFGARLWKDRADSPKYINSSENPLYSKRDHLFGLNLAKDDISKAGKVIVVEGYLDMITPFLNGVKNIVASLGTALTTEQIRLLRRYSNNVILIYDPDKAGQLATMRALDLLLDNEVNAEIVCLPQGFDPDLMVRKQGVKAFNQLIEQRVDFFDYKLMVLKNSFDLKTIDGKTKISQELLKTIDRIKSEIQRYEYVKKLSSCVGIREEILLAELNRSSLNQKSFSRSAEVRPESIGFMPITEKIVLKYIFSHAKALEMARKALQEEDFSLAISRKAAAYAFNRFDSTQDIAAFSRSIEDKEVAGFITGLLVDEDTKLDPAGFKDSLVKMRKGRAKVLKTKIKEEMTKAEQQGDRNRLKDLIEQHNRIK